MVKVRKKEKLIDKVKLEFTFFEKKQIFNENMKFGNIESFFMKFEKKL